MKNLFKKTLLPLLIASLLVTGGAKAASCLYQQSGGTGTCTSFTAGSIPFSSGSGLSAAYGQNNSNLYLQNSATMPQALALNTNVALSVNTNGDQTGTDAINIYGQADAFLLNSQITNSFAGFNTDGAFPGFTSSSSRGTAASLVQLNANDTVGGFTGWGTIGTTPVYQNLGGMLISTIGTTANNLGGALSFVTKTDNGILASRMVIDGSGDTEVIGRLGVNTLSPGTQLQIRGDSQYLNTTDNAQFWITGLSNGNDKMYFGVNTTGTPFGYFQATESGVAVRSIAINPSGGNVGIGSAVTAPTAHLEITAGSSTVPQLKIDSGTLLSTTQAGAVENDGTHIYYTATNAGTRFQLDETAGTGLTLSSGAFSVNSSQSISTLSNLTSNGLIKTSGSTGALSIASAGIDYQAPITLTTTGSSGAATFIGNTLNVPQYAGAVYTAGTGLTLTAGAFSVNTSQNIATLSNLTSNGLVTTSGGAGTLSVTVPATGMLTFLGTPSSANLAATVTDETGSGLLVFGTSPTLVTPALGTPSALVGTNITGTATSLTSGITQSLASATSTVNVSSATAPTSGQVLTATSGTAATWQTPTASTPLTTIATAFETAGRFVTSGTTSFGSSGVSMTIGTADSVSFPFPAGNPNNEFDGNPVGTWSIALNTVSGTSGTAWFNIGAAITANSTSTLKHFGYKVINVSGTATLYATESDGTTESVSSAIFNVASADYLDLVAQETSTGGTFTAQKNGGAKTVVTLSSNKPSGTGSGAIESIGTSAGGSISLSGMGMTYSR